MSYNNIVKISEKSNKRKHVENLPTKLPTLQISASFAFIFTMGRSENIWYLEKPVTRK